LNLNEVILAQGSSLMRRADWRHPPSGLPTCHRQGGSTMAIRLVCITLGAAALAAGAAAQDSLQTVTVTGRAPPSAGVAGFGDVPLAQAPFAAAAFSVEQLRDAGVGSLADVTRLDAGVNAAYNAEGYWSNFTMRGYALDPRANYRRDGLPINAETALWLANKRGVTILKGTSGMQAGVSAPGGLVDLGVKRPVGAARTLTIDAQQAGTLGAAIDLGNRLGPDDAIGWRVNAAYERLDPMLRSARGTRSGFAAAADWRISADSMLEAEFELSHQSQPSQPGFSVLGNAAPDAGSIDPRINLNNQPWTTPVVLDGRTASLRWTQRLAPELKFTAHAMAQRLRSDDRIAFPFGCSAEGNFDRYCSDGSFDLYDYRSDHEQRDSDAVDLNLSGRFTGFAGEHRYTIGALATRHSARFEKQAFNFVGTGTIDGASVTPPDPTLNFDNTDRDERSAEFYLRDQWALTPQASLWIGLRHTRLDRRSALTDGSAATSYEQSFTTPWFALSHRFDARTTVYASWGEGVESAAVPNLPAVYDNPGQALPAAKSRQVEAGIKGDGEDFNWSVAAFDIARPLYSDLCAALCTRTPDGRQRHTGAEASAQWHRGAWSLAGSAAALRARRERSIDPADDGLHPTNVPERSVRLQASHRFTAWPGFALTAGLAHEGTRIALPDNSISIPSWTRLDLGARLVQRIDTYALTWRVGVDNLADRRAWKESPYQFGHAYLFPLAPRTWRASLQGEF
jgi:iron complex outermembrane recepter protein